MKFKLKTKCPICDDKPEIMIDYLNKNRQYWVQCSNDACPVSVETFPHTNINIAIFEWEYYFGGLYA